MPIKMQDKVTNGAASSAHKLFAILYYRGKKFVTMTFVIFYKYAKQHVYTLTFLFPERSSKVLNLLWTLGMSNK